MLLIDGDLLKAGEQIQGVEDLARRMQDAGKVIASGSSSARRLDWITEETGVSFAASALRLSDTGRGPVLALTQNRNAALSAGMSAGIVPLLLSPSAGMLIETGCVEIASCAAVPVLLDSAARSVLDLTRLRAADVRAATTERISALIEAARAAGGLCIYGAGTIGRQALSAARLMGVRVKAFVDANPALSGTFVHGVVVQPPAKLVAGVDVVVPALGRHMAAVRKTLAERGARVMTLSELNFASRRPGEPEPDYLDDLHANRLRYIALHLASADAHSRAVLNAVLSHRLSLATEPLEAVCERDHPQWFAADFLPRSDADVFVDGGAFNGDTVDGYVAARGLGYRAIHAFELDPAIAAQGRERTKRYNRLTFHAAGLSDRRGYVSIHSTGGTDGSIGAAGAGSVEARVDRLDDLVDEPITYLKLDVEGEEARALAGAVRHLREDHPTVGMALYHKAQDLWDLPRRLLEIRPDYRLFLRHYTDVAYETVVYAVPAR